MPFLGLPLDGMKEAPFLLYGEMLRSASGFPPSKDLPSTSNCPSPSASSYSNVPARNRCFFLTIPLYVSFEPLFEVICADPAGFPTMCRPTSSKRLWIPICIGLSFLSFDIHLRYNGCVCFLASKAQAVSPPHYLAPLFILGSGA